MMRGQHCKSPRIQSHIQGTPYGNAVVLASCPREPFSQMNTLKCHPLLLLASLFPSPPGMEHTSVSFCQALQTPSTWTSPGLAAPHISWGQWWSHGAYGHYCGAWWWKGPSWIAGPLGVLPPLCWSPHDDPCALRAEFSPPPLKSQTTRG